MPRKKKQLGRPARGLPPRIDATGEEIAQVFMRTRPPGPPVDLEKVPPCSRTMLMPNLCCKECCYMWGSCRKC